MEDAGANEGSLEGPGRCNDAIYYLNGQRLCYLHGSWGASVVCGLATHDVEVRDSVGRFRACASFHALVVSVFPVKFQKSHAGLRKVCTQCTSVEEGHVAWLCCVGPLFRSVPTESMSPSAL